MRISGLPIDIREQDAEQLPLPQNEFDLVWAWGVIHHSRSTETIVQERRARPQAGRIISL
jgi:hypothetical protein